MHAALFVAKSLRYGAGASPVAMPVSGGAAALLDSDRLSRMTKTRLRRLVNCMPGIVGDKMGAKGKWIPTTCKELRADLLALIAAKSDQALPGRTTARKRPCASL